MILSALAALAILFCILIWLGQRRRAQSVEHRLAKVSRAVLHNFLIPDGNEGEILIEYALLTRRGVLVLDLKDVSGHVFGSDSMQDWTVISGDRRYTFSNPQPGLYDRITAVKRLLPDLPVGGYVVFSSRANFSKGQPADVILMKNLCDSLGKEKYRKKTQAGDDYMVHWDRLRQEAVTAGLDRLLRA